MGRGGSTVPGRTESARCCSPSALMAAGSGPTSTGHSHWDQIVPWSALHTFLEKVWKELPEMTSTEAEAARMALVALVAGIVRSEGVGVNDQSALPALRAQLDRTIEERLKHGPIRLEDLAAVHLVSTRTIHRAFALTGDTMKTVVRAQRLAAVRQDLLNTNMTSRGSRTDGTTTTPVTSGESSGGLRDSAREYRQRQPATPWGRSDRSSTTWGWESRGDGSVVRCSSIGSRGRTPKAWEQPLRHRLSVRASCIWG